MPALLSGKPKTRQKRKPTAIASTTPVLGTLPPVKVKWPSDVLMVLGVAVVVVGVVIAAGEGSMVTGCLFVVGVLIAAAAVLLDVRRIRKLQITDPVTQTVSQLLGIPRPLRSVFRYSHWSSWWDGVPQRILIMYAPGCDDDTPEWRKEILEHLRRRFDMDYRVVKQDRRRCRLVCGALTADELESAQKSEQLLERAKACLTKMLGEGTQVSPQPGLSTSENGGEQTAFEAKFSMNDRLAQPAVRRRMEQTFSVMMPGRWRAAWDLESDRVTFRPRPPMPSLVPNPGADLVDLDPLATYADLKVPYAIDEDGNTMVWQPSVNAHMLVTGLTGSGKTVTMRGIITFLALHGWRIQICDGKLFEYMGFEGWPNIEVVNRSMQDQVPLIHGAADLMNERSQQRRQRQIRVDEFQPTLLVLDEFAQTREELSEWYTGVKQRGEPTKLPMLRAVRGVGRMGRTARVHMLVGLQRPDAEFLSGEMRDNFGARLSMGRLSPQGAMMMWENAATGVALPRKVRGRGITLNEDSDPVEVQAFWTPDPEDVKSESDRQILDKLRPPETRYTLHYVKQPDPVAGDEGEPAAITYADWVRAPLTDTQDEPRESGSVDAARADRLVSTAMAPDVEGGAYEQADEPEAEFGPPEETLVSNLNSGDRILIEGEGANEYTDLWGVIEDIAEDLMEEGRYCIDWRSDDDEQGSHSVDGDELIPAMHPADPIDS